MTKLFSARSGRPSLRWAKILLIAASILAGLYLLGLAWGWDRVLSRSATYYNSGGPLEPAPANSKIFLDVDAYYWLSYAREIAETDAWRIRWTFMDNTPDGRPMHWSQSVAWLMIGGARLRSLISGGSTAVNLEAAAVWIQPCLHWLLAVGGAWLIFRPLGLFPALTWIVLVATSKSLFWTFHPFRPDHHSLQILCAVGQVGFLTRGGLGWHRRRDPAGRWFVAAGLLGGMGIWFGATVGLVCTGLALTGMLLLFSLLSTSQIRQKRGGVFDRGLWTAWGFAGGTVSLFLYLLEYFPGPMTMRLEVNHPLYALAFVSAGQFIGRFGVWRAHTGPLPRTEVAALGVFAIGLSALPLALYIGPTSWHALKDPAMLRLHAFISEFQRADLLAPAAWLDWILEFGTSLLALPTAIWLIGLRGIRRSDWAGIWMGLFISLGFLYMTHLQNRWTPFWVVFLFWLTIVVLVASWRRLRKDPGPRRIWKWACAVLLAQAVYSGGQHIASLWPLYSGRVVLPLLTGSVYREQVARVLARERGTRPWRILTSDPSLTGILAYRAGIPSVVSYYWENTAGLYAATRFFADDANGRDAHHLARERGWTHLVVMGTEKMAHDYFFIRHGYYDEAAISHTLGGRLRQGIPVPWLVPDPAFRALEHAAWTFKGQPLPTDDLHVYRLQP